MVKKKNSTKDPQEFPKIYRFITERIKKSRNSLTGLTLGYALGIATVLVILASVDLITNLRVFNEIKSQRQTLLSQVSYWEKVVEKQPGYRDGYFMLSVLEYQLKRTDKSEEYLKKVLSIDPNFEPARDLQKVFDKED